MPFDAWKLSASALASCALLAGCATPEMKMTPAASSGVGVRFAQGEAVMVSAGERGAIALLPVRYDDNEQKLLFVVAGYNRSGQPINFGPENLTVSLDTGAALHVHDFDGLRHEARIDAANARMLATVEAAGGALASYEVGRKHPARARALMQDVADNYGTQSASIGDTLVRRIVGLRDVLQTTTIDPTTFWGGWVVADRPTLADGEVRRMQVAVTFAGETHRFALFLAPEGAATPPQISLPAVTRADGEVLLHGTLQTWLWNALPAPPSRPVEQAVWVTRF